ncbi:histidine-tRNA ligase [Coprinellus micaceus]|uniref:histidine--tRNA ligase n=1 Tax=Coprinellus micaceus TaxID=71717 RepID=A0A4Y7TG77_COPMI|nr:histidine-tRNA ligase [Coprinellus micaceus]
MSSSSSLTPEALEQEIATQTTRFNELRLNPDKSVATPEALNEAKQKLAELKKALALAKNAGKEKVKKEGGVPAAKGPEQKKERLLLKTAKGTRDFGPAEMFCREHIERIVKECFTTYGGSCLDTPVFERKDVLTDKYGEDSKLIFDLKDQGGEELALRYDHTVPLARYIAMNGGTVTQHKIWQVGKVYRRDNPVVSKGRMREFTQADIDIVGLWDPMVPDAEILSLLCTILTKLDVGEFTIKLNNRKILDGIFEVCGVPADKIRTISSAVDKLDKAPWAEVKKEMTEEKGLDPAVADKIGEYVKLKGGEALLETLTADATLLGNARAKEGINEMGILFRLLKAYQVIDKILFDLSLARGLDYYTGIIYEAVVAASAPPAFNQANAFATGPASETPASSAAPTHAAPKKEKKPKKDAGPAAEDEHEIDESQVGVGSIAAGGRYDNLVSSFIAGANGILPGSKEYKKIPQMPCVGVSIGMDRIFALVWPKWVERSVRVKETMVYVISAGDGLLEERISLVRELREAGVKTDFLAKNKPKLNAQFAAGEKDEVPFAIIVGGEELAQGLVTVKEQRWELKEGKKVKIENEDKGVKVKRSELVDWLKNTQAWRERDVREWA